MFGVAVMLVYLTLPLAHALLFVLLLVLQSVTWPLRSSSFMTVQTVLVSAVNEDQVQGVHACGAWPCAGHTFASDWVQWQ